MECTVRALPGDGSPATLQRCALGAGAKLPFGGTPAARCGDVRPSSLLAASCLLAILSPGCAAPDDADDEEVDRIESAAATAGDELAFIDRAYATFIEKATSSTYAPLRDGATSGGQLSSYYRATCNAALVGAVWGRAHASRPNTMVLTWIRDAITAYPRFQEEAWGHHVRFAPAVDCLLAASVAKPWLSSTDLATLRARVAPVADAAYGFDAGYYLRVGAQHAGNSQAEEAALGADFLYLASRLAASNDAQRDKWRARSTELFRFAASIPRDADDWRGEAFRKRGSNGALLGPDETVVTNHGMETSPYYSLGTLISYADAMAVARATGESLPPGIGLDRTTWTFANVAREQLGVREIFAGGMRRVDRTTFGWKGTYRFVGEKGELASQNALFDYGAQTMTVPIFPPGSELLIPTKGTGSVTEFFDPLDRTVKGYQIDGAELRAFQCGNEVRGWFCRARYKSSLAEQWSSANVADQSRYGASPLPTSGVDTFTQWIENGTTSIGTDVFAGNRVWRYVCSGAPRVCRAVDSVALSTHLARYGFGASTANIGKVDAASAFVHVDGTGRRYWVSGDRILRATCRADFTGCTASSTTLASQFAGLAFSPALPTDRVDSLVQFVRDGVLDTYVFRGDRLWKYQCTERGCTPSFTQLVADQWRGITNQERWADGSTTVLRGVTDWGVQATMMNASFAFANVLGIDGGAYDALIARQRNGLRLANQPLLPSTFDPNTGRFGYTTFGGAKPVAQYGSLVTLEDGFSPKHYGPYERLNSFTWMNLFAARNHAVAYMLKSGSKLPARL